MTGYIGFDHDPHNITLSGNSAFISDTHLGTSGCRAGMLLDFLASLRVNNLFLVGDIIDLERMEQVVHWPASHTAVLQQVIRMANSGVNVVYIPGNHDARLRAFAGSEVQGVKIRMNIIHTTADGRRLLVTHGDQFDAELRIGSMKEKIGSKAYNWLLEVDAGVNRMRKRLGYDKISIASALKMRIKSAQAYIREYELLAARHAKKRALDGIVCGHIHKPASFDIDGVGYYNDGDWVEHCSALIEQHDGTLQSIAWQPLKTAAREAMAAA